MLRATALLLGVVGVASEAVDLTPDNFDKEVLQSGKSAFIKFLAPW
jgi:protein disulfide-isomerase A6